MAFRWLPRRRWLRWLCLIVIGWFVTTIAIVLVLRVLPPLTSAFMLGRMLEARSEGPSGFVLRYRWTPIEEVSPQLPIALVAAEDQKFPVHSGFDVEAIQEAIDEAEDGGRARGASTISQQVAKNLFLWSGRSYVRKGLEVYFTVLIEVLWPKQRILEVYLNIAEFGDGIYGAHAASERFFGIAPARLDARQSALLAAVLPNPRARKVDRPSAFVQRRAEWIQRQVRQLGGPAYVEQ